MTTTEQIAPIDPAYIDACREAAVERKRNIYIYWSPTALDWVSTVHLEMVPNGARYMIVKPLRLGYTNAWWTGGDE